jgi:anti-anti-sigma factor
MSIKGTKQDGFVEYKLEGRLDTRNYPETEKKLMEGIENGERVMLLDLSNLSYISSSGLRVLLMVLKKLHALKGTIVLLGLQDQIKEIFEISGFNKFFDIYDERSKAIEVLINK